MHHDDFGTRSALMIKLIHNLFYTIARFYLGHCESSNSHFDCRIFEHRIKVIIETRSDVALRTAAQFKILEKLSFLMVLQ